MGNYTPLPDERPAWTAAGNVLTLMLALHALSVPGIVDMTITLMREPVQISTFGFMVIVEDVVYDLPEDTKDYFHVPGLLPAPATAEAGQYLLVASVDSAGHVTALKTATPEPAIRQMA